MALQRDAKRFAKEEIEASVSGVPATVLDHVWEAARVAGYLLPCLESGRADRQRAFALRPGRRAAQCER